MNARDLPLDAHSARLSEYLDGDLPARERAELETHLEGCAACRALLADLRRIVATAGALTDREPARDLWPALAERLAPRGVARRRWLLPLAFAAGVLATLLGARLLGRSGGAPERLASAERYLLLLHEPEGYHADLDPAAQAAVVERYARWAAELGAHCLDGEELDVQGLELRSGREPRVVPVGPRVGGYFVLAARDEAQARELARTCPHLEEDGWIELRRIRQH